MKNKPSFLVIGATGLIGSTISQLLYSRYPCSGTRHSKESKNLHQLDICDKNSTARLIDHIQPDVVILASNLSGGVHYAQNHPEEARRLHFDSSINAAKICKERGLKFVYLSTECVFDGKAEHYTEESPLSPLSVYGKCKADCETWIRENMTDYIIARTMSVFGWQPETKAPNAIMSTYFHLQNKQTIQVPSYRWGTPTYVKDLGDAIIELCLKNANGTFQITGSTYINRFEWIKRSCEALGWNTRLITEETVKPDKNIYPLKVHLDNTKFCSKFSSPLHKLDESLHFLKDDITDV